VRTIKESCLERMILFGEGSLRKAVHEFVMHLGSKNLMKGARWPKEDGLFLNQSWLLV
jgi:hypothetical protein